MLFFIGMTLATTIVLLLINEVMMYRDRINKIKSTIDCYISSDKLKDLLIVIKDDNQETTLRSDHQQHDQIL